MKELAYHKKIVDYFPMIFIRAVINIANIYYSIIYPLEDVIVADVGGKRETKEVNVIYKGREPTANEKNSIESVLRKASAVIVAADTNGNGAGSEEGNRQLADNLEQLAKAYTGFSQVVEAVKAEGRYIPEVYLNLKPAFAQLYYRQPVDLIELMHTYAKFFKATAENVRDGRIQQLETALVGSFDRSPTDYIKEVLTKLGLNPELQIREHRRGRNPGRTKPEIPSEQKPSVVADVA